MKRGKGAKYEREVCRDLSLWVSDNKYDDLYWRSSMSGGRSTVRHKKGKRTIGHGGDICSTSNKGRFLTDLFTIELKKGYNRATLHDLLDKPLDSKRGKSAKQTYELFLDQAMIASRVSKTPFWMLIHKRDRREALVLVPDLFLCEREMLYKSSIRGDMTFWIGRKKKKRGKKWVSWTMIHVFPFRKFLKLVSPDALRKMHTRIKPNGQN